MFRWRRGLLHGLIPFGLVIAGGVVLLVLKDPVDPEKAGEGVGRLAFFAFLAGLGISYLAQTSRRKAAVGLAVGLAAALLGVGALVGSIRSDRSSPPLRAIDRAALVAVELDGQPRLRHPTLGFSILRPPQGYVEAPGLAAIMASSGGDPSSVYYAYAEEPPQAVILVGVLNGAGESRAEFERAFAGIRRGLEDAAHAQAGASAVIHYLRDEITGDDLHPEAHLHVEYAGVHIQLNGYALRPAGRPPVIVTVMVVAPEPTMLADVLASFAPPPDR